MTLSFDDGPPHDEELAALLRDAKVTATFYLMGGFYDEGNAGHGRPTMKDYRSMEIGAHAWSHRSIRLAQAGSYAMHSTETRKALQTFSGQAVDCFAWPYGEWEPNFYPALENAGFKWGRIYAISPANVGRPTQRWTIPISARVTKDAKAQVWPLMESGGPIHIAGHAWEIDGEGRAALCSTIDMLRAGGYEFLPNSAFFSEIWKV